MSGLAFDGVNDQITFGDINALDTAAAMSISFWLNPVTGWALNDLLIGKKNGGNGFIISPTGANTTLVLGFAGTSSASLASAMTIDQWDHWTWVYNGAGATDADKVQLYKNGIAQTLSFSGTLPSALVDSGATALIMGQEVGVNFATMQAANLKIWTAALSASEAWLEFRNYIPSSRLDALLIWAPLDDGVAIDYSGNGNNGTITECTAVAGPPGLIYPDRVRLRLNSRRDIGGTERRSRRRLGFVPHLING